VLLLHSGDTRTPGAWSGIPYHLAIALGDIGCNVRHVRASPPDPLARGLEKLLSLSGGYHRPDHGWEMSVLRSVAARRRLRAAPPGTPVVQIGTGFALPDQLRIATYEDMTMPQALRSYPEWRALSERSKRYRIKTQAEAYARAAVCCTTSSWAARSIVEDFGVPEEKVRVIGVGCNHWAPRMRERWDPPRYLFVGLDWERKNGDAVIRAFAEVRDRHPEATLAVVGRHSPQEAAGVTDHGFLDMERPDHRGTLSRLYGEATCFVLPSRHEPSAVAYAEALASGLPIVGTREGGSAEIIGDGGVVIDPESHEDLVAAMLRFADPTTAQETSERARRRSRDFTWEAVARRLVDVLGVDCAG
jgi:glycosyltransferase involved in cell wall biosynthesis